MDLTPTKPYNEHLAIRNGRLIILSESEFKALQIAEIRKFQKAAGTHDNDAAAMWIQKHAHSFRQYWSQFVFRTEEMKKAALDEMQKHRWIESEKAGKDLGVSAEMDWLKKYGCMFQEK